MQRKLELENKIDEARNKIDERRKKVESQIKDIPNTSSVRYYVRRKKYIRKI